MANDRTAEFARGKEAVRMLRADHSTTDEVFKRIAALENGLYNAQRALIRAKEFVGPGVLIRMPSSIHRPGLDQPAPEWFDEQIKAVADLVSPLSPPTVL